MREALVRKLSQVIGGHAVAAGTYPIQLVGMIVGEADDGSKTRFYELKPRFKPQGQIRFVVSLPYCAPSGHNNSRLL